MDRGAWWATVYSSVSCSVMSNSATPQTVAHQASLSLGFSRQEYWSRLPFPSAGDLPDLGVKPESPALQVDSLLAEQAGQPINQLCQFRRRETSI